MERAAIRTTNGRPLIEIENPPMRRSSDDGVRAAAQRLVSRNPGQIRRTDVRSDDASYLLGWRRLFRRAAMLNRAGGWAILVEQEMCAGSVVIVNIRE